MYVVIVNHLSLWRQQKSKTLNSKHCLVDWTSLCCFCWYWMFWDFFSFICHYLRMRVMALHNFLVFVTLSNFCSFTVLLFCFCDSCSAIHLFKRVRLITVSLCFSCIQYTLWVLNLLSLYLSPINLIFFFLIVVSL